MLQFAIEHTNSIIQFCVLLGLQLCNVSLIHSCSCLRSSNLQSRDYAKPSAAAYALTRSRVIMPSHPQPLTQYPAAAHCLFHAGTRSRLHLEPFNMRKDTKGAKKPAATHVWSPSPLERSLLLGSLLIQGASTYIRTSKRSTYQCHQRHNCRIKGVARRRKCVSSMNWAFGL